MIMVIELFHVGSKGESAKSGGGKTSELQREVEDKYGHQGE